ncbi:hypothetical protein [Brevundimonas aurantiaca]|uniref:hypothetical protein n=1 Tax=Brevundimonas aurantiaca TaxID=74316 RepID=UPI00301602B3
MAGVVDFGGLSLGYPVVRRIAASPLLAGGGLAATVVFSFTVIGLKLNIAWKIANGVPENWLGELSAVTVLIAAPVALLAGGVAGTASALKWITRD